MIIKYFAPSYKRPEKSITQIKYPFVKLVVKESEADEYIKNGNKIITCPDNIQGNLCRVRNWMLDNLFEEADCIIIIDDDCKGIGRWQNQKKKVFNPEELLEFSEQMSFLCNELDFKFWGLNCVMDKGAYREYTPFNFTQYIGGPFQAHLKNNKIRYDENLSLKEDYDITLQNMKLYGGALRVNFAHYDVKQSEQTGGCANYRNLDEEKRQFFMLQKKWGKDIIKRDITSKKSFDYNPIIKIPIKGI